MSLTDELLAKLQGAPLQQVSQQLGISDTQASGAISAALPVLMGALATTPRSRRARRRCSAHCRTTTVGWTWAVCSVQCWAAVAVVPPATAPASSATSSAAASRRWKPAWPSHPARQRPHQPAAADPGTDRDGVPRPAPRRRASRCRRAQPGPRPGKQQVQQQGGIAGGLLGSVLDQDGDGQPVSATC